tara:strand:- start:7340 stop:7675 length:336 start_codon:yes stop_codon:yes gene_type:complete
MDTKLQKERFIEAYQKSFGNVSQSCKAIGIARQTYYNWLKDKEFETQLQEIKPKDLFLDFVESKLVEKINSGDTTAIIFALKTKGKPRGYVERQEIETNAFPDNVKVEIVK